MLAFLQRLLGVTLFLYRTLLRAILLGFVATGLLALMAIHGDNLFLVYQLVGWAGRHFAGQAVEHVDLRIDVNPGASELQAAASVTVAIQDDRQQLYFLLNPGLSVSRLRVEKDGETQGLASTLIRPWPLPLAVVWLDEPLTAGSKVNVTFDYAGSPYSTAFGGARGIASDDVLLDPASFWFPTDVQGFFTAHVRVTAPAALTVLHTGSDGTTRGAGDTLTTDWEHKRPVAGMALVLGRYTSTTRTAGEKTFRLHLGDGVRMDPERILDSMVKADAHLTDAFGDSGFQHQAMFVTRKLARAFNDGSGLMGSAPRYYRTGDYGYGLLAHELAHNWWGATVAEKWLTPATGGQWIVEGFASYGSWLAIEAEYGRDAMARAIASDFFDPDNQVALRPLTSLDNALAQKRTRDTIYRKGAMASLMLRNLLGPEPYRAAIQSFLTTHRYHQVSDTDLKTSLETQTGTDLSEFFEDWLTSNRTANLAFRKADDGNIHLTNTGTARIGGFVDVLVAPPDGGEMQIAPVRVGDPIPGAADSRSLAIDPYCAWADVEREDNRFGFNDAPIFVSPGPRDQLLAVIGDPTPWARMKVDLSDANRRTMHLWDFSRGILGPPRWNADGSAALVSHTERPIELPSIVRLGVDGTRRTLGKGETPEWGPKGLVYAADDARIVAIDEDRKVQTVVERSGWTLRHPLLSPDQQMLAYVATRDTELEVRVRTLDSNKDQRILRGERDRLLATWSSDGRHIFLGFGTDASWKIVRCQVVDPECETLADGIVTLRDLAVSPDGERLAFSASTQANDPTARHRVFLLELAKREVSIIDDTKLSFSDLSWQSGRRLLAVARKIDAQHPALLPAETAIEQIDLDDPRVQAAVR